MTPIEPRHAEEAARLVNENAHMRAVLQAIVDAWVGNNSEGDDYDEGYDDGLHAAHDLARHGLEISKKGE